MGKREVGQLGTIDLIVSIEIAELMALCIEKNKESIWMAIIPILILVFLEVALAFVSLKFRKLRLFFDGKPAILIHNGKIDYKELLKQRYSIDDLLLNLRINNIDNIAKVNYAILEHNGNLSIFKKHFFINAFPLPIIIDGKVANKYLKYINKDIVWVNNYLRKKELNIKDIFYAYYDGIKLKIITK